MNKVVGLIKGTEEAKVEVKEAEGRKVMEEGWMEVEVMRERGAVVRWSRPWCRGGGGGEGR